MRALRAQFFGQDGKIGRSRRFKPSVGQPGGVEAGVLYDPELRVADVAAISEKAPIPALLEDWIPVERVKVAYALTDQVGFEPARKLMHQELVVGEGADTGRKEGFPDDGGLAAPPELGVAGRSERHVDDLGLAYRPLPCPRVGDDADEGLGPGLYRSDVPVVP